MSAAAALSSSKGAAGVRTTKVLFFIFTLLGLVCLARSTIDEVHLENLKEIFQNSYEELEHLKAERSAASKLMKSFEGTMNPLIKSITEALQGVEAEFPTAEGLLEHMQACMRVTKTYTDEQMKLLNAKIKKVEEKVVKLAKLIKYLEEDHDEL